MLDNVNIINPPIQEATNSLLNDNSLPPLKSELELLFDLGSLPPEISQPNKILLGVPWSDVECLLIHLNKASEKNGFLVHMHNNPDPDAVMAAIEAVLCIRRFQISDKDTSPVDPYSFCTSPEYRSLNESKGLSPVDIVTTGDLWPWMIDVAAELNIRIIRLEEEANPIEILQRPYLLVDVSSFDTPMAHGDWHPYAISPDMICDHHYGKERYDPNNGRFVYNQKGGPLCSTNILLAALYLQQFQSKTFISPHSTVGKILPFGVFAANATDNCMPIKGLDFFLRYNKLDTHDFLGGLKGVFSTFHSSPFTIDHFGSRIDLDKEEINLSQFYMSSEVSEVYRNYCFPRSLMPLVVMFHLLPLIYNDQRATEVIEGQISIHSSPNYLDILFNLENTLKVFSIGGKYDLVVADIGKNRTTMEIGGTANEQIMKVYKDDKSIPKVLVIISQCGENTKFSVRITPNALDLGLDANLIAREIAGPRNVKSEKTLINAGGDDSRAAGVFETKRISIERASNNELLKNLDSFVINRSW
jgi:hypothetical protein